MTRIPLLVGLAVSLLVGACDESSDASISASQLADRIANGSPPFVLDVRTRKEFERGRIPGAVNIPHDELPTRVAELEIEKASMIIVYCQSGRRAGVAERTLRESGFSNVRDLTGHWQAWQAAGLATE